MRCITHEAAASFGMSWYTKKEYQAFLPDTPFYLKFHDKRMEFVG